jgi:AcrR family transcriptional regulator
MWFVEIYSAGPEAVERLERLGDTLERLTLDAMAESPDRRAMPPTLMRAILGGLRQIVHARLRSGRQDELFELMPDVLDWALGYRTPPQPLEEPAAPPSLPPAVTDPADPRARIVAAVTAMVAEKGYQGLVITEIAQRAAVSLSTFYADFESKADAFVAAIEDGERRLTDAVLPVYREAPDWPSAVRDGLYALFAFLASNPATAQLGGRDVYSGGPRALDRHESSKRNFQALLYGGYIDRPSVPPIVGEAIGGSVSSLIYQQLRRAGPDRLYEMAPTAIFVALAPFVGSSDAAALANAGWQPAASA